MIAPLAPRAAVIWLLSCAATPLLLLNSWLTALKLLDSAFCSVLLLTEASRRCWW